MYLYPKSAPARTALQATAATDLPGALRCLFTWSGAGLASQDNFAAARGKGRPAKGVYNEKMKSTRSNILSAS